MLDYTNSSTLYLSQSTGDDHYSGFAPTADGFGAGPVRTMARILDLLWNLRTGGCFQPITVRIMGDYVMEAAAGIGFGSANPFFPKTFSLNNVIFEGYGSSPTRILGGRRLSGFQKDSFNGVDCLSLCIPEVAEGKWHFTDLYVGGKRATPTRYPKVGTLRALTTEKAAPESFLEGSRWFVADKRDLDAIEDVEHATVSFYHYWVDEHSPIESYDRESGRLTMRYRSRFQISADYERDSTAELYYYLEHVPQSFSAPGEWYLDVPQGMLYYIPRDTDPDTELLEVYAPVQSKLFLIEGCPENPIRGIRLRNLEFFCTKGDYESRDPDGVLYASDIQSVCNAPGAVSFAYAEDCSITNCRFSALGLHAVEIGRACRNIRVEDCRMEELGGGGVTICGGTAEDPEADRTSFCTIRHSSICNIGQRYAASCGILIRHAAHNEIVENEIAYTDYSGISVGWVWGYHPTVCAGNRIASNHIHHIGMGKLSDMGGIYLLGMQEGTVVEGNTIHDIQSAHYGGFGIYTDEGSSYIAVENNIVYRCKTACYHQHYGSHNTLRGNVFAFGGEKLIHMSRSDAHLGILVEENTLITDGEPVYCCFDEDFRGSVLGLQASSNRIWDVSGHEPVLARIQSDKKATSCTLAAWQSRTGKDLGSRIEPPEDIEIDGLLHSIKKK